MANNIKFKLDVTPRMRRVLLQSLSLAKELAEERCTDENYPAVQKFLHEVEWAEGLITSMYKAQALAFNATLEDEEI